MTRDADQVTYKRIAEFLSVHTTLTLATVGPDRAPAAAAVFYAHDDDLTLYFLSEEQTLHAQNILANPDVAGTIQADRQDWKSICGLQLRGRAELVPAPLLPGVVVIYSRKFAFVASALAGSEGPAVLLGPLARARFWRLTPVWFRLTDNTVRFGHKEELDMRARNP